MARKLPWKRESDSSPSNVSRNTAVQSSRLPHLGPTARDDNRDVLRTPVSRRYAQRVLDSDPIRSPSTSPPPERPHEEFMIPGPLNDDKYRMVEDEFLHMAQRFTAHLHRAEYDRLKALAKAQNAATIREIERPVVANAVPTIRARQRSASAQQAMKQRKTLEGHGEAKDDETVFPLVGTSLRGLMEAPRRDGRTIMPAMSASSSSSKTRAAAGYSSKSSPQRDPRSRARSPSPSLPSLTSSSKKIKLESPSNAHPTATPSRNNSQNHHMNPQGPSSSAMATTRRRIPHSSVNGIDDELDDDPFGLHERRMNRSKPREQLKRPEIQDKVKDESNKVDLSSIPTFL